ncbi:MAG: flavodoxin-dependent (E)-4-hydroxy-3-methylbut-2-enyl-diphosphate synthase [Candidatus Omnitrophota bacterium]
MIGKRRKTRQVAIGGVKIGRGAPISIQSMAKTSTRDAQAVIREITALKNAGCEIVRLAIKNEEDVSLLGSIKKATRIPIVADIHFDYRLALSSIAHGVDAIRLNPGNIYKRSQLREIIGMAKLAEIPIRVGANSGSLRIKSKGASESTLMVKSVLGYIKHFEQEQFHDIIISLKSSDVLSTILAYRKMAVLCDYPFHLGVTATGVKEDGMIKSAIGIGSLLSEGIGDTIRVSLTADPVLEVELAKSILQSLGLRRFGPDVISCPTCGRCQTDIESIVREVKKGLSKAKPGSGVKKPYAIAIMGCEVNGPGEAKGADIGIAAGKGSGVLFKKGKVVKKIKSKDFAKEILSSLRKGD